MNVQHITGTWSAGGSEEGTMSDTISAVGSVDTTSIMGESTICTGTGTYFPRGFNTLYLSSTTTVEQKRSDGGQTQNYAYCVVEWPSSSTTNYEVDLEYQRVNTDTTKDNAEIRIQVTSHTGTEGLGVSQWSGSSWTSLGTVTSTGWTSLPATVSSSTITIRILGTVEDSDLEQDSWDISSLEIYTWSSEEQLRGEFDEWTTDGIAMTLVVDDYSTFAELDAEKNSGMLTACWDFPDLEIDDESIVIRWRYNTNTAPASGDYRVILQHDGTNTTFSMLSGTWVEGLSHWFVFDYRLSDLVSDIDILEKVFIVAVEGMLQIEYVTIGDDGFGTTGLLTPTSVGSGDTLAFEPYGFSVSGDSESSFDFDKVDTRLESSTSLEFTAFLEEACDYYVEFIGLYENITVDPVSYQLTQYTDGWNTLVLNISSIVGTSLDMITRLRFIANDTVNTFYGIDSLWFGSHVETELESGADYVEYAARTEGGIAFYDLDSFSYIQSTLSITSEEDSTENSGLLSMFVGRVNFTQDGPAHEIVSFLEDGTPESLEYWPRDGLRVSTNGHDLCLHVITNTLDFIIGENESRILLDNVVILEWISQRVEFLMTGWFDGAL